jgi:hypothetical protein
VDFLAQENYSSEHRVGRFQEQEQDHVRSERVAEEEQLSHCESRQNVDSGERARCHEPGLRKAGVGSWRRDRGSLDS